MSRQASVSDVSSISDADDIESLTHCTTPSTLDSRFADFRSDKVEGFRNYEYPQLKEGAIYLDHGGTTLYAKSLMEQFSADMISNLYGNPHSASSPSARAGHRVDAVRERALRFFNADPEKWDLVFTANATAAIKLVTECLHDHAATSNTPIWYGYHKDSHTSLVGARQLTKLHRCFGTDQEVDLWIDSGGLGGPRARQLGLFAYPGQSNMTGRRLPLSWPGRIRKNVHKATTYTLLDAAALASTAPLKLSDTATAPDFVALSFYKIFGFPDIGALLVQKKSQHVLESRRYFGGGTVDMVISINDTWHAKKEGTLHDSLEDGTLPFHSIFALDHAISVHQRLYGPDPMSFISMHTANLGKHLYDGLSSMTHFNGKPVVHIYKDDQATYGDPTVQGATIAFNVTRADGTVVGYADVEKAADDRQIYVRSGSLCNPGGVATYLNWSPPEMKAAFQAGHRCSHPTQIMFGRPTGVVRASLGAMNTLSDVEKFLDFLSDVYQENESAAQIADSVTILFHTSRQVRTVPVAASIEPQAVTAHTSSPRAAVVEQASPRRGTSYIQQLDGIQSAIPDKVATRESISTVRDVITSKRDHEAAPPLLDYYFPGKLPSHGRPRVMVNMAPRTQTYKDTQGAHAFSGMAIKVKEVDQKLASNHDNLKTASVRSRKSFGLKNLLHRKDHQYLHPDMG